MTQERTARMIPYLALRPIRQSERGVQTIVLCLVFEEFCYFVHEKGATKQVNFWATHTLENSCEILETDVPIGNDNAIQYHRLKDLHILLKHVRGNWRHKASVHNLQVHTHVDPTSRRPSYTLSDAL